MNSGGRSSDAGRWRGLWVWPLVLLLLALATLGYHAWVYPHLLEPVADAIRLTDADWLPAHPLSCQPAPCRLVGHGDKAAARIWVAGGGGGIFRLRYELRWEMDEAAASTTGEHGFRVAFFPEVGGRLTWNVPHVFLQQQLVGVHRGEAMLRFADPVGRYQLSLELRSVAVQQLTVRSLELREYRESNWQRGLLVTLILVWLAAALAGWRWFRGLFVERRQARLLLSLYLLLVLGTQVPNGWFTPLREILSGHPIGVSAPLTASLAPSLPTATSAQAATAPAPQVLTPTSALWLSYLKKTAHFFLFALLAWHLRRSRLAGGGWAVLALCLTLALATEAAQGMGWSRTPSLTDWAIDLAGCLAGLLWFRLRGKVAAAGP